MLDRRSFTQAIVGAAGAASLPFYEAQKSNIFLLVHDNRHKVDASQCFCDIDYSTVIVLKRGTGSLGVAYTIPPKQGEFFLSAKNASIKHLPSADRLLIFGNNFTESDSITISKLAISECHRYKGVFWWSSESRSRTPAKLTRCKVIQWTPEGWGSTLEDWLLYIERYSYSKGEELC